MTEDTARRSVRLMMSTGVGPSLAACGSSAKLARLRECQCYLHAWRSPLQSAHGPAQTVLNVGAGTDSANRLIDP
jgi:hypothetical protein